MKKIITILCLGLASFLNVLAEIVTNETIIQMLGKGYDSEIIIGYIDSADEAQIELGLEQIDALMAAGADKQLIAYLQKKRKQENKADNGLYWWNTGARPQKLNLVALSKESKGFGGHVLGAAASIAGTAVGINTGSIGAIAGSWIAGDILSSSGFKSDKLVIAGEHAHLTVKGTSPVFRLVLPDEESKPASLNDLWYHTWFSSIQSPHEFQLLKLKTKGKGKKAKRTFPTGLKWSTAGFTSESEIAGQDLLEFEIRQINNRVYEVYFPNGLEPGEYAFFYRNAMIDGLRDHLSAFDFTVTEE